MNFSLVQADYYLTDLIKKNILYKIMSNIKNSIILILGPNGHGLKTRPFEP